MVLDCWGVGTQGDYAFTGSNGFRIIDPNDLSSQFQYGYDETKGQLASSQGILPFIIRKVPAVTTRFYFLISAIKPTLNG